MVPLLSLDPETLLLTHIPELRQLVERACWRRGLRCEVEDVLSAVTVKLVDNDYAVVRVYKGQATFDAYLYRVVDRFVVDYQRHLWGKWRPSVKARRFGAPGLMLDRLISRDNLPRHEAINRVASCMRLPLSDVTRIVEQLTTTRLRNRGVQRERAGTRHVLFSSDVERAERQRGLKAVNKALSYALGRLTVAERTLLRMRYVQGLSVREIAECLRVQQKQLYRVHDALLRRLRRTPIESGVDTDVVLSVMEDGELIVDPLMESAETA